MRLISIPEDKYENYRLNLIFDCYKWDPQFLDHNTVSKHALVISQKEYQELIELTEALDKETRAAEEYLNQHLEASQALNLPRKIYKEIKTMKNYDPHKHVRLMRYDFHPIVGGGWAISEVNSDVPGGFAESSLWPVAAMNAIGDNSYEYKDFGNILINAICEKIPQNGKVMLVHCTCYSDDRQVMQFLGDRFEKLGYKVIYAAGDHLKFENGKAISILDDNEGEVDAIIRFSPLEWIKDMRPKRWDGYFNTETVSCNHPIALFAQTKRFPFVWDILEENGISMATWRKLLPETLEVKDAKDKEGFIYKPAYGRVGEYIGIKEACTEKEYADILKEVKLTPKKYLAQKKFISSPVVGDDGKEYHICIGSYSVNGKHAGFYARISDVPRIDSNAADIPILIEGGNKNE